MSEICLHLSNFVHLIRNVIPEAFSSIFRTFARSQRACCRDSFRSGHVWAGRTTWSINHWHVSFKTWFGLWTPNVRVHEQEWAINNLRGTDPAQAGPCSARSFQWAEWARWGGLGIWHQTETWRKGECVGVRNYLGAVFMAFLFDHWGLWKIISLPGLLGIIVTIHATNPSRLMNVTTWFIGD